MKTSSKMFLFATAVSCMSAFALVQTSSAQHVAGGVLASHTEIDVAVVADGWSALDLLRRNVRNEADDFVGYVHDVIVSPDGSATFVIVNVAGFLNVGSKLVAIPVEAFNVTEGRNVVLPNASKENLKDLPSFIYN